MATVTTARINASLPLRRKRRVLVALLLSVPLLLMMAAAISGYWFYSTARAALPQVDGTIQIAGLSAAVTVVRDAQGMPHISAANVDDLLFAQGYVTAQDRLWQMDVNRRFGSGELAEILG